jgi:nicotinamidase-related amidase
VHDRVNTALIVVDMLNRYDHADADSLMESVRDSLPAMRRLIDAAREREILSIYVNDNHGDWSANAGKLSERALGGPDPSLVEPIVPADDVPFVIKARHSIFYETQVEYLLRRHDMRAQTAPADARAFAADEASKADSDRSPARASG